MPWMFPAQLHAVVCGNLCLCIHPQFTWDCAQRGFRYTCYLSYLELSSLWMNYKSTANSKGGKKSDVDGNSWRGVIREGKWDGFGLEREKTIRRLRQLVPLNCAKSTCLNPVSLSMQRECEISRVYRDCGVHFLIFFFAILRGRKDSAIPLLFCALCEL